MSSLDIIRNINKKAAELEQKLLRTCLDTVGEDRTFLSRHAFAIKDLKAIRVQRILGMSLDSDEGTSALHSRLSEAVSGMETAGSPVAFLMQSDGASTRFYIGGTEANFSIVVASLQGGLENADWDGDGSRNLYSMLTNPACGLMNYGGAITGMPILPECDQPFRNPVHTIVSGMQGIPFTVMYLFKGEARADLLNRLASVSEQQSELDEQMNVQFTATETNQIARSVTMFNVKRCMDILQRLEGHLSDAVSGGGWRVFGAYMAANSDSAQRLNALIQTALGGRNSGPEPIRVLRVDNIVRGFLCSSTSGNAFAVPSLGDMPFTTNMSSRQIASLIMLPDKEVPGYFINDPVRFDINARMEYSKDTGIEIGKVLSSIYGGKLIDAYTIPKDDLDRHALVVGATGGGKSNTTRMLLKRLWEKNVPFMVIESAKSEYWQLARLRDFGKKLCALQLGDILSPFRLNPFECIEGFSLQTHVDSLLATFNAAFEMYPPMPYILEQAVYQVYRYYGWNVATGQNMRPSHRVLYPTLTDLYLEIPKVVARTAYDNEVRNNVQGALQTRVRSLMIGGKGAMMDVRHSTPMKTLLKMPLVLELESLGDDAIKSFCIGLLMNRLYEYRRASSGGESRPFSHMLVLEEAHRLLKRTTEQSSSTQAASVAFFCNMLSEIRSYGQGILIADQSPVKLAQDAIRNTNVKIVHRIVDEDDRQAVGGAMHMNESQIEALTVLGRGCAAVYSEGDNRPRIVKMPLMEFDSTSITRAMVLENGRQIVAKMIGEETSSPSKACHLCPNYISGRCSNERSAGQAEILFNGFRAQTGDWELARKLIEDQGPGEETLYYMLREAFKHSERAIKLDDHGIVVPECGLLMLCAAGKMLSHMEVSDAQQRIAVERFSVFLSRRISI